jgi:hypothetical protein
VTLPHARRPNKRKTPWRVFLIDLLKVLAPLIMAIAALLTALHRW